MKHLQRTARFARVATVAATLAGSIVVAGTGSAMAAPKTSARPAYGFACASGEVCLFNSFGTLIHGASICDNNTIINLGSIGEGDTTYMMVNEVPGTVAQAYNYSHGWVAVGPGVGYDQYWTYATGSPQGIDGFKLSC